MVDGVIFDAWNEQKKSIHKKESGIYFREGDVRWVSLGMNVRSEAYGKGPSFRRPVLIIKKLSSETSIVIPLSSQPKEGTRFCPYTLQGKTGYAMLYQVRMMHRNRFQRKIGELDTKDFDTIKKRFKELLNL